MFLFVGFLLSNIILFEGFKKCINNYLQVFYDVFVVAGYRGDGFTFVQFGIDLDFGFVYYVVGFFKYLINLIIQVYRDGDVLIFCCK